MQNNRWFQTLIVLLVVIAAGWLAGQVWGLMGQFSNVFLLFFLAWLIAFILRPLARWLTNKGLPYTMSVGIVYLGLALVLGMAGFLLVPVITQQLEQLYAEYPKYLTGIEDFGTEIEGILKDWGVTTVDVQQFYRDLTSQIQSVVPSLLLNTLNVLQSVATLVLQLIIVFLLSFYFMKDGEKLSSGILQTMPPRWQDEARLIARSLEKSFGGFIRGQVVFALVYGVLNAIVMLSPPFQLDYVLIASIVAGLAMIIPLAGNFIAYIPAMLVCLVTPDKAALWPWLLLVMFIMQSIMMNFLGPRIMSSAIGIHPLYVVGAMLIGGQVAGLWGALFGIPVAGAVNLVGRPLMRRARHQMPLYQEVSPPQYVGTSAYVTGPLANTLAEATPHNSNNPPSDTLDGGGPPADRPERPTEPHLALADVYEEEPLPPPQPTPSARVARAALLVGSRALSKAWARRPSSKTSRQ